MRAIVDKYDYPIVLSVTSIPWVQSLRKILFSLEIDMIAPHNCKLKIKTQDGREQKVLVESRKLKLQESKNQYIQTQI